MLNGIFSAKTRFGGFFYAYIGVKYSIFAVVFLLYVA
jgi:hypothetical protein